MEKPKENYRNYSSATDKIKLFYQLNHQNQTFEYATNKKEDLCAKFDKCQMNIWEAISKLDTIVDESDPDLDLPQIVHAFQTAEGIRSKFPNDEWLHLVGLIHDLGKVMLLPEFGSNEQWEVVGDTFPLGCAFSEKIVYHDFFQNNIDSSNKLYQSKYGIYNEACGFKNMLFSFGHDEYLYQVLLHNGCTIPELGLNIIRFHSFYSWHKEGAYTYFEDEADKQIKKYCQIFSECDLYTKDNFSKMDIDVLKQYYQSLVDKYFPKKILDW